MATLRWNGPMPVAFMGHPEIGTVEPGSEFQVPDEHAEVFHRRDDIELVSLDVNDAPPEDAVPDAEPRVTEQRGDALITKPAE